MFQQSLRIIVNDASYQSFNVAKFRVNAKNLRSKKSEEITNSDASKNKLELVAGSKIQTTGTVDFEDGFWIGNHLKSSKCPAEGLD